TPGCLVTIGEKLWCVTRQIIAIRAEMVVNHVQQYHQATCMSGLHQGFQVFGPAIGRVRREWQYAVVAPVAATGEIRDGHQLDDCNAKRGQMLEPADGGEKGAFRREGADVQL